MAHDFNNILTIVSGFTELLLSQKKPGDPDYDDLEKVVSASHRGSELVRRLMSFSRKTELQKQPLDLNKAIDDLKCLLCRTIPKSIDIEVYPATDLRMVNADPVQVEQVFVNLALNARDAMPDGGRIVIETMKQPLTLVDEELGRARPRLREGAIMFS